jgi:PKD repeat protein
VDAAGHPQIAYLAGGDDLRYAYFTGSDWFIETIDDTGRVGVAPALALDPPGRPHIVYFRTDWPNDALKYAWHLLPFRPTPTPPLTYTWDLGDGTPAAGESVIHTYAVPGTYRVTMTVTNCLTATTTAVHTVTVQPCRPLSGLDFSWEPSLPAAGDPATFTASVTGSVPIAYAWAWGDGSFSTGRVVSHTFAVTGTYTVVLTATNCATTTAVTTHTVIVGSCIPARDPDFSWQPAVPGCGVPVAFQGSATGTPPFTYTWAFGDGTTGVGSTVEHTYRFLDGGDYTVLMTVTNCYDDKVTASHNLTVTPPLCADPTWASLAASPARPWSGEEVTLTATVTWTVWQRQTVVGQQDLAGQGALALDPDGRPQISYYHVPDSDLRVARYDGTTWITETVDSAGDVGQYSSLALYTADNRHVVYYDATNGNLNYGWYDGTTWWYGPLDTAGDVGKYTSLDLDAGGLPHFSYYDATHGDLRYGYYNGSAWVTETVDSAGNVGLYGSLELDAAGRPHIAYFAVDPGTRTLKYAYYDGTAWLIEAVRTLYWPGEDAPSADLALDAAGRPYIAYRDRDAPSLCYSPWPPPCCGPLEYCGLHYFYEILYLARRGDAGWTRDEAGGAYSFDICTMYCVPPPPPHPWIAGDVALAVDTAGRPTLFYVGGYGQIRVYRYNEAFDNWEYRKLGHGISNGGDVSIALDARGLAHAVLDGAEGVLAYLWQDTMPTPSPINFFWRLGDGSSLGDDVPVVHHVYDQAGTYTVTVQVSSDYGTTRALTPVVVSSALSSRAYLPLVIR